MLSSVLCSPFMPPVCHLLLFHTLCPCSLSSLLFLPCHPDLILHLCVLQPLDTFSDSSPSVGRQHAFQPRGHNAAILTNQWQINQCYLFFPCLCCHWFFFFFLLLCCLPRLELCSIKLSSLSDTNCNSMWISAQTDANVSPGWDIPELYLWDAPLEQKLQWFLLKLNLDLSVLWTLCQMRHVRCLLWLSGLSFWTRANICNADKTNTFWSHLLRKKEAQLACK